MEKLFITIKSADIFKRIDTSQILYIQVDNDCSIFHLQNGERFSCSKSLREISELLPPSFFRINRNCLVNINKLSEFKIKKRKILLFDGSELTVSFRNIKSLTDTFTEK